MQYFLSGVRALAVMIAIASTFVAFSAPTAPAFAEDEKPKKAKPPKKDDCVKEPPKSENGGPVGYGGARVQLMPFMTPYHSDTGIRYLPLTLRLTLDAGLNERPACFTVPIVHDRILTYLYSANLTADDFTGEKADVLMKSVMQMIVDLTGPGYFTHVEIVGPDAAPLDCKSKTLSTQCK